MKLTFWASKKNARKIQDLFKKYPSIRLRENPIDIGNKIQFCLEGNVIELNIFEQEVEEFDQPSEVLESVDFFRQLKNWFKNGSIRFKGIMIKK